MPHPFARLRGISLGERRMFLGCLVTAILGGFLALVVVLRLDPEAVFKRSLGLYERWIVLSGALGGVAGVVVARNRLGRPGLADAVLGIAVMTFSAAIIGGTLALPLYGTMFGPFTLGVIFTASPLIASLWLANGVAVCLMVRSWHAERESIFKQQPDKPSRGSAGHPLARLSRLLFNP